MDDPNILIKSLTAALEGQPEDLALRLHLANLLRDAGQMKLAQAHCEEILSRQGDHAAALALAAEIAAAAGDAPAAGTESPSPSADNVVPLRLVSGGAAGDDWDEDAVGEIERPLVTLKDVGGMEAVKRQLDLSFLAPLKNPEYRKMYGKSLRGGLLLYGPPGCGKTFIARATAGELGAKFLSIGLTDVLDMWMGASERNLHELFETARRNAPCVLFLDEIDGLGQKRSHLKHSGLRSVVNALLAELDGVDDKNEGVFVLAATNHPWDVDSALKRPGRLDRTLLVLPPDREARTSILAYHLREKPTQDLNLEAIAKRSDGCSGADLLLLCESATELAMEQAIETGDIQPIGMSHFKAAFKSLRYSTVSWFETARNYALYSNEDGAYDELLAYLRRS